MSFTRREEGRSRLEEPPDPDIATIRLPPYVEEMEVEDDDDQWGDRMEGYLKDERNLRIGAINCGGLPGYNRDPKNESIKQTLLGLDLDICGLSEVNQHWRKVDHYNQLRERTLGWWRNMNIRSVYNIHEIPEHTFQAGGVSQWTMNETATRIYGSGVDPSGLGRWVWVRYRGSNGIMLQVYTCYRPNDNNCDFGAVKQQHIRQFARSGREMEPIAAFWYDLRVEVRNAYEAGYQLIVMGDIQEDVRSQGPEDFFDEFNMREGIMERQGVNSLTAPNTYKDGRAPIDGIFVSRSMSIVRGGFLSFSEFPSDHRMIWLEVTLNDAFGQRQPPIITPDARRLQLQDPRTVDKFNNIYREFQRNHQIPAKLFNLQRTCMPQISAEQCDSLNNLDRMLSQGKHMAERRCRHLKKGGVSYSLEMKALWYQLELWRLVLTRKRGGRVGTRLLRRAEKHANIFHSMSYTLEEARAHSKRTMGEYREAKKTHIQKRITHLEDLAKAKALQGDVKAESILKNMKHQEQQRKSARAIKWMNGKYQKRKGITKVAVSTDHGEQEAVTKDAIENGCLDEAHRRFTQASNTPMFREPLRTALGDDGFGPSIGPILNGTQEPFPEVDEFTNALLPFFKRPECVERAIASAITTDEFIEGWKKMKERTSGGPSGHHFGMMKAIVQARDLAEVEATLANIPYATGTTLDRWKHGTNVMLEKKKYD